MLRTRKTFIDLAACSLMALAAASSFAADKAAPDAAQARYKKELAACDSSQSTKDRAACVREAGAALAESRQGRLAAENQTSNLRQNALARCAALPLDEREACRARMNGQGKTEGSADSGGIYRELTTPQASPPAPSDSVPAPRPPAAP